MKIIKITSMACTSCIIMNNHLEEVLKDYDIQIKDIDYDFDDISNYNIGKIIPVIIFCDDDYNEISRLVGEHTKQEIIDKIGSIEL